MNSYFRIWRNARIVATTVRVELVNEGNEPVLGSIATLPWSEFVNDYSPILLANRPRSKTKLCGLATGMSRQSFTRTYHSQEELGAYAAGKDYWFDNNSANFTTPDDQLAPAIVLSIGAADPGLPVWAALVSYEVTYHLRFFNVRAETVSHINS